MSYLRKNHSPIILNEYGIYYAPLKKTHGIQLIPWRDIEIMDIFSSVSEGIGKTANFLRIGLTSGETRLKVKKSVLHRISQAVSLGRDVNIPVDLSIDSEQLLQKANEMWVMNRDKT